MKIFHVTVEGTMDCTQLWEVEADDKDTAIQRVKDGLGELLDEISDEDSFQEGSFEAEDADA
jgi:hypothetical protein